MSIFDKLFKKAENTVKNAVNTPLAFSGKTVEVRFDKLPESLDDLKAHPASALHDPFAVAAFAIAALNVFPKNKDACVEMMNYLKGPRPLTNHETMFIRDRFMDGVDYVPRSYFAGTSPDNEYTPTLPYTVKVMELAHSKDNFDQGYLRLFVESSGADSPRYVDLRHKPSTDQWFLWEFAGVLSGIRIPKSKDAWA